jgi:hypothetical protein
VAKCADPPKAEIERAALQEMNVVLGNHLCGGGDQPRHRLVQFFQEDVDNVAEVVCAHLLPEFPDTVPIDHLAPP